MIPLLCNDKHVVLVGNSVEGFNKKQGKDIDSFDVVVRFGKGVPDGHEEYIGSRTDIWSTGSFRAPMRSYYPDNIPVLYNSDYFQTKKEPPSYEHIPMFDKKEMAVINNLYDSSFTPRSTEKKRISIGVLTALYFCVKVNTFASLTFINFDFFSKTIKFKNKAEDRETKATSWHLPLLRKEYDVTEDNPAHDIEQEKYLVSQLLKRKDVFFIGDENPEPEYIEAERAAWDSFRVKITS